MYVRFCALVAPEIYWKSMLPNLQYTTPLNLMMLLLLIHGQCKGQKGPDVYILLKADIWFVQLNDALQARVIAMGRGWGAELHRPARIFIP
ncbi:hypothetical protein Tco_0856395 [Tanacetum coccineum]|uniref:Secreted protein n=1 Tax=Tanacetum coccineum TaxID=301880 RepID=A0ABQ5B4C2_9ASTR